MFSDLSLPTADNASRSALATAEKVAEYRRRCRRIAWQQCLILLGFLPFAVWLVFWFVPDGLPQFLSLVASAMMLVFLTMWLERAFRCPTCDCQFQVDRTGAYLWQLSPQRRAALYGRFLWCDCCGSRFEILSESVAHLGEDDDGLGILQP